MTTYPVRTRHWTRTEYDRLVEIGVLHEDEPIELLGGQLIVAEPKGTPHTTAVGLTADALRVAFGPGWVVRVPGGHRDYRAEHPSRISLLVEIADWSLAFDRRHKGGLYARAGVADYWIVNLVDEALEVYRRPAPDPSAEFGWRYLDAETFRAGARVSPLARPDVTPAVVDLLP
jgi:Uma2 family endonuclease